VTAAPAARRSLIRCPAMLLSPAIVVLNSSIEAML